MSAVTEVLMPVVLLKWRRVVKGTLGGFAHIQIGKLEMREVQVLSSRGTRWAAMPARRPVQDHVALCTPGGKPRFEPMFHWSDKAAGDRFSASVVAAIVAAHGADALADGGAE